MIEVTFYSLFVVVFTLCLFGLVGFIIGLVFLDILEWHQLPLWAIHGAILIYLVLWSLLCYSFIMICLL